MNQSIFKINRRIQEIFYDFVLNILVELNKDYIINPPHKKAKDIIIDPRQSEEEKEDVGLFISDDYSKFVISR